MKHLETKMELTPFIVGTCYVCVHKCIVSVWKCIATDDITATLQRVRLKVKHDDLLLNDARIEVMELLPYPEMLEETQTVPSRYMDARKSDAQWGSTTYDVIKYGVFTLVATDNIVLLLGDHREVWEYHGSASTKPLHRIATFDQLNFTSQDFY
jgi:hypothetical protein